jgi:serine/threonine protein kinase
MNAIVLKQRYRILGPAGQGGMGTVYRAVDTQLGDRVVAIKELQPTGQSPQEDAEAAAGFKREALMLARLSHPSLPSIHDHFFESERWYLVMDYLPGQTLEERLRLAAVQRLPVAEVICLGTQLCEVLEYLHGQLPPIIFRDLKPANIMLTPGGHLYLIDFGIARFFRPGQTGDTEHLGTHGYAAPEQYSSSRSQTGARTDLYGLGATLHHALTGSDPSIHPFQFAPARLSCPQAPIALESLIARLVRNDESQRPASAAEVRAELARIVAAMGPAVAAAHVGQPSAPTAGQSTWYRGPARSPALPGARRPSGSPPVRPPITAPSQGRPTPQPVATRPSSSRRWSSARPDPAAILLAGLLMFIIFWLCVWGTVWLSHSFQVLFSPPVVANLAGHVIPIPRTTFYTCRGHAASAVGVAWYLWPRR